MKCVSCSLDIPKEFKSAISANRCPGCGKRIIESGNLTAFVPLCELLSGFKSGELDGGLTDKATEELATLIISTFNVRVKGAKDDDQAEVSLNDPDADFKRKQLAAGKKTLEQLREEAYHEAELASVGIELPAEGSGTGFVAPVSMNGADIGEQLIDQKRLMTKAKMEQGIGSVKRAG
jgi:hypothetical protein